MNAFYIIINYATHNITYICCFSIFETPYIFCSFEFRKFGDLVQDPFLYLKLTLQQPAAIVQSQAKTQHIY